MNPAEWLRRTARRRMRLVCVRHPDSGQYRFCLSNITPEQLDAESLAQAYACRWQVELLFRELKSHYRLAEMPSRKAHVVETLLLTAVITLLVSRKLLAAVRHRLRRRPHQVPEERWAAVFASVARDLLDIVLLPKRLASELIQTMAFHEFCHDLTQDFDIWANKIYVEPPLLTKGDGPVGHYRKWCRQFYPQLPQVRASA